jgi:hypothetical protein
MRNCAALAVVLSACIHNQAVAVDGAVLGRVVIYRNGVAFYEKHAVVEDGKLSVHVPRERVDDFLKSLTVVDPTTNRPLSVTIPRTQAADGYLTMTLDSGDARRADVLLTYVTEAAAWKPSYRVVVGNAGKVMLEAWAIVDNVSGEDWNRVQVGVGASSALSFRYDLWSVRRIDRDLLQGEDRFAVAPPTGVSPYAAEEEIVSLDANDLKAIPATTGAQLSDEELAKLASQEAQEEVIVVTGTNVERKEVATPVQERILERSYIATVGDSTSTSSSSSTSSSTNRPADGKLTGFVTDSKSGDHLQGVTIIATNGSTTQTTQTDARGAYAIDLPPGTYNLSFFYGDATVEHANVNVGSDNKTTVSQKIDQGSQRAERSVASTTKSPSPEPDNDDRLRAAAKRIVDANRDVEIEAHGTDAGAVAAHANAIRDRLVASGVASERVHIVQKVGAGERERVRLVALAPGAKPAAVRPAMPDTPVGESRFIAERPMTVRAGSSAMVAMVHGETTGGVVYLYDPLSERGDSRFAFKAVRLDNPTGDALEAGPVTVFGDGRFIGEGLTEPVPAHASVVIPFALDRQVVVERGGHEDDRVAKLMTAQRGVVTAELQHRRTTTFAVTSRLTEPTVVYLRHRLEAGWTLVEAPPSRMTVGDSQLFAVELPPGATKTVAIVEATPVERSLQLASDDALALMQIYVDDPDASPQFKAQLVALLATHRSVADLVDRIATLHDQLAEYRERSGELHAQLVTLRAVRTGGDLMATLRTKLAETSERIQRATIAVVDTQEELMLARVKLQNQLADLHLEDATTMTRR